MGTQTSVSIEVGSALRAARLARGLTLKMVGSLSAGRFSPTAVAGYERGERNISLQRFLELTAFYGVSPEMVLAALRPLEDAAPLVDLTELESEAHNRTDG